MERVCCFAVVWTVHPYSHSHSTPRLYFATCKYVYMSHVVIHLLGYQLSNSISLDIHLLGYQLSKKPPLALAAPSPMLRMESGGSHVFASVIHFLRDQLPWATAHTSCLPWATAHTSCLPWATAHTSCLSTAPPPRSRQPRTLLQYISHPSRQCIHMRVQYISHPYAHTVH